MRIRKPADDWLERRFINSSRPSSFPNSIYLELTNPSFQHEGRKTTQGLFTFIRSRSSPSISRTMIYQPLLFPLFQPYNVQVRFPTRIAFLDSLILRYPIGSSHRVPPLEADANYASVHHLSSYIHSSSISPRFTRRRPRARVRHSCKKPKG